MKYNHLYVVGMPKPIVREHSFILKQSKSVSMTYSKLAEAFDVTSEECDYPMVTNLPIVPLHSLRVSP